MSQTIEQIGPWLNAVGVPGLLAVGLYALHKGWVVTGREHARTTDEAARLRREDLRRYEELKAERDEWKATALRHLTVAERAVGTAETAATAATAARTQTTTTPTTPNVRSPGRGGGG